MKSLPAATFRMMALIAALAVAAERPAIAAPPGAPTFAAPQRFIVKFKSELEDPRARTSSAEDRALARRANLRLEHSFAITPRLRALALDASPTGESPAAVLARLRADPAVEYAEIDRRMRAHAVPNDPLYTNQWYLRGDDPAAIRAESAWDITTGSPSVVVAFLDTGVRFEHPDLLAAAQGGRLLPGYDFVSDLSTANDGDGRDADPSDPGDWVTDADTQQAPFQDCEIEDSSWHGTRVAGILGARTNNATGIAGASWGPPLLPVRVLGKCGGFTSDIVAALRWAAGMVVPGVPPNLNPARIINVSLGGVGSCSQAYREAVADVTALGVLVVVSAGNDTGRAVTEPANCPGALAVSGLRHVGTKVGFSNIGPEVGISAPAGNCVNTTGPCLRSLDTTYDRGITTPQQSDYTNSLVANVGTSFAAPMVSAVAALARSVNGQLSAAQTVLRLQQGATPFPSESGLPACQNPATANADQLQCNCTTSTCGAGMLNATGTVSAALRPFVIATANPTSASGGQTVNLDGSGSFASNDRSITSYAWSVVSSGGSAPALSGANLAQASFTAPTAGRITLRLMVTDSAGDQDSAEVSVTTPTPVPPASNGGGNGGGGGGGGSFFLLELLCLLFCLGRMKVARHR